MDWPYLQSAVVVKDIDSMLQAAALKRRERINVLRTFYICDHDQVITTLNLVELYKSSYPVGLDINDFILLLKMNNVFEHFESKSYIYSMINRMTQTGLLELRANGTFDITSLGHEYIEENFKK